MALFSPAAHRPAHPLLLRRHAASSRGATCAAATADAAASASASVVSQSKARPLKPALQLRRSSLWSGDDEEGDSDDDDSDDLSFQDDLSELGFPGYQVSAFKTEQKRTVFDMGQHPLRGRTNTEKQNTQRFTSSRRAAAISMDSNDKANPKNEIFSKRSFCKMQEEFDFDERWLPLLEYLSSLGLRESDFILMSERHIQCLNISLAAARERMEYLLSIGVKEKDIKRILIRQPQILGYAVSNLKSHVAFLAGIGVPDSRIGQIIAVAPSLFSYNIEQSLKPTIRYLIEEVGIRESEVGKVVQLSPQILVQRIDNSWSTRLFFLSKELGAPKDSVVKMVMKHPQLLHYSIEDGILPRINFLRSIGMRNSDILKVLTNLTQVLSLSLEDNLKPKYLYLVDELHNKVDSLAKYPMYLSLSLDRRIKPRHRFLVSLKKVPKGPFPLRYLLPADRRFCQMAGTSIDRYLSFKAHNTAHGLQKRRTK